MAEDQNPGERTQGGADATLAATREILAAISRHRGDEKPVFDVILENACRLCNAQTAFVAALDDAGTHLIIPAWRGASEAFADGLKEFRHTVTETHLTAVQAMVERRVIRIDDIADTDTYRQGEPVRVFMVDVENIRSLVTVPLLSGVRGIGSILLYRREVDPFTDDDIALIEGFAEQAVVAIENARQFREVQERLKRETATKNILRVISRSRDDETPVFDAILDEAVSLCGADSAGFLITNEERTHNVLARQHGDRLKAAATTAPAWALDAGHPHTDAVTNGQVVQVDDMRLSPLYVDEDPTVRNLVDNVGVRTALSIPLMQNGAALGALSLHRLDEVKPFSADDIALLESFAAQAVIAIENVRQFQEVQDRLERETATKDILRVISQSREDEAPVFSAILDSAAQLCDADSGSLMLINDQRTHTVLKAISGKQWGFEVDVDQWPLDLGHAQTEAARTGEVVHEIDLKDSEIYRSGDETRVMLVDEVGLRTALAVPLLQGEVSIGVIVLHRLDVARAFSSNDIKLVESFAAQAVIAIENVHQFRALQTRLEREAATREILEVISRSRDDETPVFETILKQAAALCRAPQAGLIMPNEAGTHVKYVASWGAPSKHFEVGVSEWSIDEPIAITTSIRESRIVNIPDLLADSVTAERAPTRLEIIEKEGIRSILAVPLIRDGKAIGCFDVYRTELEPFTDDEAALVETFASQAVIAIENVRQFRAIQTANAELETRLEREAATREILSVISQSRDDEQPVFQKIVEKAAHLCNSQTAALALGRPGDTAMTMGASIGAVDEAVRRFGDGEMLMDADDSFTARAILTGEVLNFPDMKDTEEYREGAATIRAMVDVGGLRSTLFVPLIASEGPIGALILFKTEVAPYTEDQIALIETFARQAVIAIDNVRQFRELQERLERERASAEILEVISRSRDDESPVFDVIVEAVSRLCAAPLAYLCVLNDERTRVTIPALTGARPEFAAALRRFDEPVESNWLFAVKSSVDCEVIRFDDLADSDLYRSGNEYRVKMVDEEGMRSVLSVPVEVGGVGYGCIVLYRREVTPFSDDDVELVRGFASQAVIAIENVRQFREVQTRLEREGATRNILQTISRSRDAEAPVFDAILENATRLCDAPLAFMSLVSEGGAQFSVPAHLGATAEMAAVWDSQHVEIASSPIATARVIREGAALHIEDLAALTAKQGDPVAAELVRLEGVRTYLVVPLMRGEEAIGTVNLYRREVKPFTADQIALVESFAAQAVIAIENVRQFRELQERLERERASAEILEVISKSRDDEKPVFDTILENTAHLCQTDLATFNLMNDEGTHLEYAAHYGRSLHTYKVGVDRWSIGSTLQIAESVREGRIVHNVDLRETQLYIDGDRWRRQLADKEGVRSFLTVPLITAGGKPIGCIGIYRKEVRAFSDDEIALVETFAAQAVIAIENVRQFRELQERLAREAATGEVLGVISTSRDDETPVFDAIIENASRLCKAPIAFLSVANEERTEVTIPAHRGTRSDFGDILEDFREPITRTELVAIRPVASGEMVLEDDIKDDDTYRNGDPRRLQMVDVEGARSVMAVPLIRNEVPIGAIVLYRREVAPFSADDLSLVKSFAAQAVIAIENVRQFREVQERLEREKASGEILTVISQSRDDELPVFDTILENALRLCAADMAVVNTANEAWTEVGYAAGIHSAGPEFQPGRNSWPIESQQFVCRSIFENRTFHTPDLMDTDLYRSGDVTRRNLVDKEGMRTQLVLPLVQDDKAIASFSLYRQKMQPFSDTEISLLETFAAQAVIAIENVRQFKALETLNAELGDRVQDQVGEIERMGRLKRFLPSAVADAVVTSGDESMLTSHRAMVATLFCDMRGFTAFCEAAEPEETIEVLQTYHQEMSDLIDEYGGGVDQRAGDGIMVIFNDPIPVDDPAGDAVRLAVAMREKMRGLCAKWKRLGHRLGFGVGISLGYATVGMVGSAGRFDYTASGTSVNTAARLCDMAADGEILISPRVWVAVEGDFQAESRGEVEMKGIREPVEVFAVG